jgi:hypothetical protein
VGTSNFVNKKRTFVIPETHVEEEERQRQLNKIFGKLREFEEDPYTRPQTTSTQGSTNGGNNSASAGGGG